MPHREMDRGELERLTPDKYLREGYCDPAGHPFPELSSMFATAACVQLEATGTSPQELGATLESLGQVLPWHREEDPHERLANAVAEALELCSSMYDQPNNEGIVSWLAPCIDAIHTVGDADAFVAHFTSVVRQYSVIMALRTR